MIVFCSLETLECLGMKVVHTGASTVYFSRGSEFVFFANNFVLLFWMLRVRGFKYVT